MRTIPVVLSRVSCALAAIVPGALLAQSTTVPGMDGRVSRIDSLTYYGRRGAAHPNGEIGAAYLNEMCNPGTVPIPWRPTMDPRHPFICFMAARESGGRMVQISDRSYVKHCFAAAQSHGACGTCQSSSGSLGVHCTDVYGAGTNADRYYLGPPDEVNPWTGAWNPVGSYFDRGDPDVGPPANGDGARSLTSAQIAAWNDAVKNRIVIKEQDLLVAGARYFYANQIVVPGEGGDLRADDIGYRGFTCSWNGTQWSFANSSAVPFQVGSVLNAWQGATVNSARNGYDDGYFFVGVVVTGPSNGIYHYEYAVHNTDNHRGAAAFRVPVDPAGVVTNIGFRDIDSDPLNDWTPVRVGNELVWTAGANNALNWNSFFNFWFDCDVAPATVPVRIDQARPGPGLPDIAVVSQGPSAGVALALVSSVGQPCAQSNCQTSIYEFFAPTAFDLANRRMTMTFANGNYTVDDSAGSYVAPTGPTLALTDDSQAQITLPFTFPYPGGATTTLWVCSNGFVSVAGGDTSYTPSVSAFLGTIQRWAALWHDLNPAAGGQVRVDTSASAAYVTFVAVRNYSGGGTATFQFQFFPSGNVNIVWQAVTSAGNDYLVGWTPGNNAPDPGSSDLSTVLASPTAMCSAPFTGILLTSSARPVMGTPIDLVTSNIPAGTGFGVLVMSLTQAIPPLDLGPYGMPGCVGHPVGGVTWFYVSPVATARTTWMVPNSPAYIGVPVITQSFTYSPPRTPLGIIASNGVVLVLGQM